MRYKTSSRKGTRFCTVSLAVSVPPSRPLTQRNAVPIPDDPRPGRFVRHLDFNHFRTIGMRRSIEEGVNSRFVTGERVEAILKVLYHVLCKATS